MVIVEENNLVTGDTSRTVAVRCGDFSGQAHLVEGSRPRNQEDLVNLAQQIQQVSPLSCKLIVSQWLWSNKVYSLVTWQRETNQDHQISSPYRRKTIGRGWTILPKLSQLLVPQDWFDFAGYKSINWAQIPVESKHVNKMLCPMGNMDEFDIRLGLGISIEPISNCDGNGQTDRQSKRGDISKIGISLWYKDSSKNRGEDLQDSDDDAPSTWKLGHSSKVVQDLAQSRLIIALGLINRPPISKVV